MQSQLARKRFLITGAAGSTGTAAIASLIQQGHAVRALVHREDERSAKLRAAGAEVIVGDVLDLDDARSALEGVDGAYLVYPIAPGLIEATAFFAQAAREASVGSLVNMSQISARRDSKSHAARNHWVAERLFDWSGVPVTHLRPTFFAQNFLYPPFVAWVVQHGVMSFPFAEGRHAPLAAEDQGRLIAAILVDPKPHQGKTYRLQGVEEMDHFAIAEVFSQVLGRPVTYQPIEVELWRERLDRAGAPAFLVQHLCAVALDYREGLFAGEDSIIEKVTGKAPMTLDAFILSHKETFAPRRLT